MKNDKWTIVTGDKGSDPSKETILYSEEDINE